jgi:cytochrome P450
MDRARRRFGDIFTLSFVPAVVAGPGAAREEGRRVFLANPGHVKQLYSADPNLVRTGVTNMFLKPLVGDRSILVLDEPAHLAERKLLLPPLHGERVARYAELMSEVAVAEIRRWPIGEPFHLWPRMQAITLEVIVRAVFGIDEADRLARARLLIARLLNRMTSMRWFVVQGLRAMVSGEGIVENRAARALIDPIDELLFEEIALRRAAPDLDGRSDILSTLIHARYEDGSPISDQQLRDELVTLLIAGHESTATALSWAFERVLRHPEQLLRLRAEAEIGGDEYAAATVQETLRLRPVLPFVLRRLSEPMDLGGHSLPAGTWIAPCAYLIHRREDIYPRPAEFRPERFLGRPPGTYTWMPFGGGVRRCLGASFAQLEMKCVLQAVLRHAELRPVRRRPERIQLRFITLAPSHGAEVVMTRRLGEEDASATASDSAAIAPRAAA